MAPTQAARQIYSFFYFISNLSELVFLVLQLIMFYFYIGEPWHGSWGKERLNLLRDLLFAGRQIPKWVSNDERV